MEYGAIMSRAWEIVSRHKALWGFGFLAALFTFGDFGANYKMSGEQATSMMQDMSPEMMTGLLVAGGFVGLLLFVIFVVLSVMGHVGLVRGVLDVEEGAAALSFGTVWAESKPFFWRMLGLMVAWILLAIPIAIGIALVVALLAITIVGLLCVVPVVFVLGAWLLAWMQLSQVSLVADGVGIGESIGRSWRLVRAHLKETLLMGLALLLVFVVVALVIAVAAILLGIPLGAIFGSMGGPGMAIYALIVGLVAALIGAVIQAFVTAVWTLVYRRLGGPAASGTDLLPA